MCLKLNVVLAESVLAWLSVILLVITSWPCVLPEGSVVKLALLNTIASEPDWVAPLESESSSIAVPIVIGTGEPLTIKAAELIPYVFLVNVYPTLTFNEEPNSLVFPPLRDIIGSSAGKK